MANYRDGFTPVRYRNGAPWTGKATMYYVTSGDATAIGIGDLVKLDGGNDGNGIRSVTRAAASNVCCGVVVGVKATDAGVGSGKFMSSGATPTLDLPQYRAASTAKYVFVADDPNIEMETVEDADTTPLTDAGVGLNINFVVTAGASTTTGISGMEIDSSSVATTNTLPLRLVERVQREDNSAAGTTTTRWIVGWNTHQYLSGTGSTGI